jgi:hypothetical protein
MFSALKKNIPWFCLVGYHKNLQVRLQSCQHPEGDVII